MKRPAILLTAAAGLASLAAVAWWVEDPLIQRDTTLHKLLSASYPSVPKEDHA